MSVLEKRVRRSTGRLPPGAFTVTGNVNGVRKIQDRFSDDATALWTHGQPLVGNDTAREPVSKLCYAFRGDDASVVKHHGIIQCGCRTSGFDNDDNDVARVPENKVARHFADVKERERERLDRPTEGCASSLMDVFICKHIEHSASARSVRRLQQQQHNGETTNKALRVRQRVKS